MYGIIDVRRSRRTWAFVVAVGLLIQLPQARTALAGTAPAAPKPQTIYVDTSAIDARSDLTATQKTQLKQKIMDHIEDNFAACVGSANVTVTNDSSKKAGAKRIVNIQGGRSPSSSWGQWNRGSKSVDIYLGEYMDDPNVTGTFKTGEAWDLDKLANGIGSTSAHELGHSYSLGHNNLKGSDVNKMTKGDNVTTDKMADHPWEFDTHSEQTIKDNWNQPPCKTETDYMKKALVSHYAGPLPPGPNKTCDVDSVDSLFLSSGAMAELFDFGWYGEDTDDGLDDGDAGFDFIYKSSMEGLGDDAEMITFFEVAHYGAQFLLRGAEGTAYEGQWFPLVEDDLVLSDWGPNGARIVSMFWDIDGTPGVDVEVVLDATDPFGLGVLAPENGFTYEMIPEPLDIRGDATGDGFVGADDLVRILTNWGASGPSVTWDMGDVAPYGDGTNTGDQFIGADDYVEVLTYWGSTSGSPEPAPEPATLVMLLLGGLVLLRRRR